MIEVRYRTRVMQQIDTGYMNDDLISAFKYVELTSGMDLPKARYYGWRIIGIDNCCVTCGKTS